MSSPEDASMSPSKSKRFTRRLSFFPKAKPKQSELVISRSDDPGTWSAVPKVEGVGESVFSKSSTLRPLRKETSMNNLHMIAKQQRQMSLRAHSDVLFRVFVLYAFEAQAENEVSVAAGEECDVVFDVMREQGWFEVVKADGQRGLIPVGFCQVLEQVVDVDLDEKDDDIRDDSSENALWISQFKAGTRDSGTITAPTMYDADQDYVFAEAAPACSPPSAAAPHAQVLHDGTASAPQFGSPASHRTDEERAAAPLSPRSEKRKQRAHVVQEVYETERAYVSDLRFICTNFLKQIRRNSVLKEADIATIFRNVETIYELHREMLSNLEDTVKAGINAGGRFPAANASIASVFISLSAYLKLYTVYCFRSSDHQILTNHGFLFLSDVEALLNIKSDTADGYIYRGPFGDLLVATYDEREQSIVYRTPRALVKKTGVQSLVSFSSARNNIHVVASDNHHMYVNLGDGWAKETAAALAGRSGIRFLARPLAADDWQPLARSQHARVSSDVAQLRALGTAIARNRSPAALAAHLSPQATRHVVEGMCAAFGSFQRKRVLKAPTAAARDAWIELLFVAGFTATFRDLRIVFDAESDGTFVVPCAARLPLESCSTWCFDMSSAPAKGDGFVVVRQAEAIGGQIVRATRATIQGNCVHQETSRDVLLARLASNKQFQKLCLEVQRTEAARNLSLESFLIKPIQRICKYPLLLRELIKATDKDHEDYATLETAHKKLEEVAEHVNEQKRVAFSIRRMAFIDKHLVNRPNKFQLALPTRRFIMEGDLLRIGGGTRQLRRVFLFSDILIYAKAKGKDKYQFRGMVSLTPGGCFCELVSKRIEPNAFQIIKADSATANIFAANSHDIRTQWLDAMSAILGKQNVHTLEPEATPTGSPYASPLVPRPVSSAINLAGAAGVAVDSGSSSGRSIQSATSSTESLVNLAMIEQ